MLTPWPPGLRHALHAVHAGLVFHHAIDAVVAGELEDDLFEAAGGAGSLVGDLELPAAALREMLVHAEEVAGEDRRLVAAGAAADLDHRVLAVVGIGRDEQETDLLLHLRNLGLDLGDLHAGHLPEFLVLLIDEDVLGGREVVHHFLVFLAGPDDRLQLLVILVELDIFLHVRHRLGAGELLLQGGELALQGQDFVE